MNDTILFLGDVFLDKKYIIDTDYINGPFVFNLEHCITSKSTPKVNKYCIKSEKNYILETFKAKPVAVCIANNHIMDYGPEGFYDTLNCLKSMKIPYFGAGSEEDNWNNPAIVNVGGKKICLLGYCDESVIQGFDDLDRLRPAPLKYDKISSDVKKFKSISDKLILNMHWGIDYCSLPTPHSLDLARNLIDLGADAIVGHHAHTIQPVEVYNNKPIAYGLGNFIFPEIDIFQYDKNGKPYNKIGIKSFAEDKKSIGLLFDINTCGIRIIDYEFDGEEVHQMGTGKFFKYNNVISRNETYTMSYLNRLFYVERKKRWFKKLILQKIGIRL